MTVGIVMLVHTAFDRAEQVIRFWTAGGCPVVVHVDRAVPRKRYDAFVAALSDLPEVLFSDRFRCEWGTWGIVAASQAASGLMLARFAQVRHVCLTSGSCLPLRPVSELRSYLDSRHDTDFIESATTADVPWTVGGLDAERFTLRFPFSWKKRRFFFDSYVKLQRRFGLTRTMPEGLVPHMGSQWWCLTRKTLTAILQGPDRKRHDAYFRQVWIPDESYYQSLVRLHSRKIESRSLTLSKFDFQGKPHIFYDDHLQLLTRSDCFIARKIWPHAGLLYDRFLSSDPLALNGMEPNPGKIDRIFSKASERRTKGRAGLNMQSRFPNANWENGVTSAPYSVLQGFDALFPDFERWLARITGARVHGHIFAKDRVAFHGRQSMFMGALSDNAALRDVNPRMFLTNLIWNTRGERQCFQFGPADSQKPRWDIAHDFNAQISVISGAWIVPLFQSDRPFEKLRAEAARLQRVETAHLKILRSPGAKARVRIWTMARFLEAPADFLQEITQEITLHPVQNITPPPLVDLTGFGQFLQNLKNQGMHPYLMGDFAVTSLQEAAAPKPRKPYLVR